MWVWILNKFCQNYFLSQIRGSFKLQRDFTLKEKMDYSVLFHQDLRKHSFLFFKKSFVNQRTPTSHLSKVLAYSKLHFWQSCTACKRQWCFSLHCCLINFIHLYIFAFKCLVFSVLTSLHLDSTRRGECRIFLQWIL